MKKLKIVKNLKQTAKKKNNKRETGNSLLRLTLSVKLILLLIAGTKLETHASTQVQCGINFSLKKSSYITIPCLYRTL